MPPNSSNKLPTVQKFSESSFGQTNVNFFTFGWSQIKDAARKNTDATREVERLVSENKADSRAAVWADHCCLNQTATSWRGTSTSGGGGEASFTSWKWRWSLLHILQVRPPPYCEGEAASTSWRWTWSLLHIIEKTSVPYFSVLFIKVKPPWSLCSNRKVELWLHMSISIDFLVSQRGAEQLQHLKSKKKKEGKTERKRKKKEKATSSIPHLSEMPSLVPHCH